MNKYFPAKNLESDHEAIKQFADLVAGGFENPEGNKGIVKVCVPEVPEECLILRFGDTLICETGSPDTDADTNVSIPMETLQRINREFERLDWRNPSIIGTINFSGNMQLANNVAKFCLRPMKFTADRFEQVGELHESKGYKNLTEIDYLHEPTQRQILNAIKESKPKVITGLEPTPPCRQWNLDRLEQEFGDSIVRVRSAEHRRNMREFIAELKAFQAAPHSEVIEGFVKPYTEGAPLPEEMWSAFGPMFFDRSDFIPPQLWMGAVPTHIPASSLHRDPLCGFLMQIIGRKRLDLYSADQAPLLYPCKAYNNFQTCWFKPEDGDFETYPKAAGAKTLSVVLNPGELLLQPAGWFHQVYALDSPNMSVSYFWRY